MSNPLKYLNQPVTAFTNRASGQVLVLQNTIQVSEAYDPQSGTPMPVLMPYVAIWDTGAMGTVVTKKVVDDLGLKPSGKITIQGVGPSGTSQAHESDTYLVNLYLPNNVGVVGVRVSENSIAGCDVLIGMDIIGMGDFAITNHNGRTTWTFRTPPCEEIDFVSEINEHNRRFAKQSLTPDEQRKLRNKQKAHRRKNR